MTNKEIADRLFIDEDEINPVSSCCSAAVSDPSGEGIEGRCTDCGEMCSIVGAEQMTRMVALFYAIRASFCPGAIASFSGAYKYFRSYKETQDEQ